MARDWSGSTTGRSLSTTTRSRAGWTTRLAKARPSSTGWRKPRRSSRQAELRGPGAVGGGKGFDLDRPTPVDGKIALRHVPRAETVTRHLGAAHPVDLVDTLGGFHEVVDILGQKAGDAVFDQLRGRPRPQRQHRGAGHHALD